MYKQIYDAGMGFTYFAVGLCVIFLFLQLTRKVSLSHPLLVYAEIVLFPIWCVSSSFHIFARFMDIVGSYETIPGGLLTILGKYSGSAVLAFLLVLFLSGIPYLFFFISFLKVNLFPYKFVRKCPPEEREAAAHITCVRLCRYALFMVVIYLIVSIYTLVVSFEPVVLGMGMLSVSLPWGIAGTLFLILIMPPIGLLCCLVVAGLSAFVLTIIIAPLVFVSLLLTIAFLITLNAVIRTCRYTKRKAVWFAIFSILPGINLCILIYFLICLSRKNSMIPFS